LHYTSANAPENRDVFGTAMLSILSGHKRYAHIAALRGDVVLPELLGMKKVLSEARYGGPSRRSMKTRARPGCVAIFLSASPLSGRASVWLDDHKHLFWIDQVLDRTQRVFQSIASTRWQVFGSTIISISAVAAKRESRRRPSSL
jgi:hypothetical protein